MKLAIVTTHPIQYNAPWFRLLAKEPGVEIKVFYTWEQSKNNDKYDPGFGRMVEWDIPLLEGYEYTFVKNTSISPGSHHYKGIVNPTLNYEIQEWDAEAVLIFGWPFKSHLACMKYFKGKIPVLFRGDSTLLDEQPGFRQIIRRLFLRYIYSFIDYALYVGTNNKRYYLAHGINESQLVFVPHAIDNNRFIQKQQEYKNEAESWKAELGISADDFVVLFAGKFNHKKNPHFMLQLANRLPADSIKFLMVGNGELEQDLKNLSADNRIIFVDFQNQSKMPVIYHMCNVFILPSDGPGETWGLAINEALACNKYVIATGKCGGAVDLIQDNINGRLIEPGDVSSAAQYIQELMTSDNIDNNSTVNNKLLGKYSFANIVEQLSGLLKKLEVVKTEISAGDN